MPTEPLSGPSHLWTRLHPPDAVWSHHRKEQLLLVWHHSHLLTFTSEKISCIWKPQGQHASSLEPTDDRIHMSYSSLLILFMECPHSLKTQMEQLRWISRWPVCPFPFLTLRETPVQWLLQACTDLCEYVYHLYMDCLFLTTHWLWII